KSGWPLLSAKGFGGGGAYSENPVLADVDGDGTLELIISDTLPVTAQTKDLHAFHLDGSEAPGWPVKVGNLTLDGAPGLAPFTAPALGDLDGDGKPEIVVGTEPSIETDASYLIALHGDGTLVQGFPVRVVDPVLDSFPTRWGVNPPAISDIDGDGQPE